MPVETDANKLLANTAITHYDLDPNATTATEVAWVDMQDFGVFTASFFRTVGTSNLTLQVLANTAADGSGTDVVVKTKDLTNAQPNAVGDYTFIEVTAAEIAQAAADAGVEGARYVTVEATLATGTDEGVVTYVRSEPRFAHDGLTSDVIA